jgi:hypothetical protein
MTTAQILERGIVELRKVVAGLWRDLSSSDITPAQRSELRLRLIKANRDLRQCLSAYDLECRQPRERGGDSLARQPVQLRFVDTDYANSLQPV